MRKTITAGILAGVVLAMAGTLTSCGGSGKGKVAPGDTIYTRTLTDSMTAALGQSLGYQFLEGYLASTDSVDKNEVLKGLKYVLDSDTTHGAQIGLNIGMRMLQQFDQFEQKGIYVDRQVFYDNFKEAFMNQDVNLEKMKAESMKTDSLMMRMNDVFTEQRRAARAATPQAMENKARGEAYIASLRDSLPSLGQLPSGAYYVIESEGTTPKYDDNTTLVNMIFSENTIDGTEVQSTGGSAYPIDLTQQEIPVYIKEAVKLLGAGGKIKLYVPGELAYGALGVDGKVGPNELIIYDIALE